MIAFGADTLPIPDLKDLLMLHFVQGELIFTDGSAYSGYYETTRIDESSTEFSVVFSPIYINTGTDIISIPDQSGGEFLSVIESASSNIMTGRNVGEGTDVFPQVLISAIIHETDRVLVFEELDSN